MAVSQRDYDNAYPVYGVKQDQDTSVVDASIFYRLPCDRGRWQAIGNLVWADIDFHDAEATRAAVLLQYNFGAMQGNK